MSTVAGAHLRRCMDVGNFGADRAEDDGLANSRAAGLALISIRATHAEEEGTSSQVATAAAAQLIQRGRPDGEALALCDRYTGGLARRTRVRALEVSDPWLLAGWIRGLGAARRFEQRPGHAAHKPRRDANVLSVS